MKEETRSFYRDAVTQTAARIIDELDRELDLTAMARDVAMSSFHFHRIFRGMLGETPKQLQRRLRMERAAWQLVNSSADVTTIAFDAGYNSHEGFTRAFHKLYGAPPSTYRDERSCQIQRPPVRLPAICGLHFDDGLSVTKLRFITGEEQMNVDIVSIENKRVATTRHIGPYHQIAKAFETLGAIAGPAGLFVEGASTIALYYDDPETTDPTELRSDAGVTIASDASLPEGLSEQEIDGGKYAKMVHRGSYASIGNSWSRLMGEWLPDSGERHEEERVCFELYVNNPMQVPEEELLTELYLPLS
jgi:AraC family transcriptional regulator